MAKNGEPCRICGEGHLTLRVEKNPVKYKGVSALLDSHYATCNGCGSEQADAAQTRDNKRLMIAFKKRVNGLLAGAEVRALRERLGLSQTEAAQVFGGGPVAFSKYESDDVAQSEAMDKLLRLTDELPVAFDLLADRAGIDQVAVGERWLDAKDWLAEPGHEVRATRPTLRVVSSFVPDTDQQPRYEAA